MIKINWGMLTADLQVVDKRLDYFEKAIGREDMTPERLKSCLGNIREHFQEIIKRIEGVEDYVEDIQEEDYS